MIANLMMYARPELEEAHTALWTSIRAHLEKAGIKAPETLSQEAEEFAVWKDPNLVLSQTCGMPYRLWLHDQVALVGTPDYGLPDCPAGYYRSPIIVRADDTRTQLTDFRESIFAYNQTFSQSGYGAPYWHMQPHGFWFENRLGTGAHRASAEAIATGQADIAALDAVTWRNIETYDAIAGQLRVLDWTQPTPGLPLITAKSNDPKLIYSAVENAIHDLADEHRSKLGITGLTRIPKETYLSIPNPP